MNEYRIKAYAKINLGLDVVRRLENGYHEVKMVMQTVGIYDVLDFERTDGGIVITTDSGELPTDENNLIYKAAKLMMETYPISGGVKIHLEKHIPIAAGMAGGSTDAAATLKGMNRLFDLGCTLKDLMELGVKIGADVPYCVMGGTALAEGIGMVEAIAEESLQGILDRMENVLETVTVSAYPIIQTIKDRMKELGAINSLMSGSGPTVFGIFVEKDMARRAYDKLEEEQLAKQIFLTEFCE